MSETITSLIQSIWKHIDTKQQFFVVVEGKDHVFVEDPEGIEQVVLTDEQHESGVMVFTSTESANHYVEYLVEQCEIQPSTLVITPVGLDKLYQLMPRIHEYSKKKYGVPCRLQAVHYQNSFAFCEVLYSNSIPKN